MDDELTCPHCGALLVSMDDIIECTKCMTEACDACLNDKTVCTSCTEEVCE